MSPALPADRQVLVPAGRRRRVEVVLLAGLPVLVGAAVLVCLAAGWPDYWRYVAAEDTPLTWLESLLLALCAAAALLLAAGAYVAAAPWRLWLLLGGAFGSLALDERFALHERLRDRVLAPADVRVPFLPWMAPGDVVLLALAVIGLVLLSRVLRLFEQEPGARSLFVAAVLVAVVAVAMDTIDVTARSTDVERLLQSVEEVVETTGQVLFVLALWLVVVRRLAVTGAPDAAVD